MSLVLLRRTGEELVVFTPDGKQIRVRLQKTTRIGEAMIAIDAPEDYEILRGEVADGTERPTRTQVREAQRRVRHPREDVA